MVPYYTFMMSGNNLEKYIKLSGMTKGDVAEQKGIAPESLSRHISGRSNFTVQDAIEYANILGTTPERILFEPRPTLIAGTTDINEVAYYDNSEPERRVVFNNVMPQTTHCLSMDTKKTIPDWKRMLWFYDSKYMSYELISQKCYGEPCVVKTKKTDEMKSKILMRRLYPNPQSAVNSPVTFTLQPLSLSGDNQLMQNVELKWACPVINMIVRPDLIGAEFDPKNAIVD